MPQRKRHPDGWIEYQPRLPATYLAPSWSWAGVYGRAVRFGPESQYDLITPFAKVLDIDIQLASQDPFGAVRGGSITLHGPFLRIGTVDSLIAPQSPEPYPSLMTAILPFLKDLVTNGYGENAHEQQVGLLMLLKWRDVCRKEERVGVLVLLGVEGDDSWRRVECLTLIVKGSPTSNMMIAQGSLIFRECKDGMQREKVRII